jgi:hypothetical protein
VILGERWLSMREELEEILLQLLSCLLVQVELFASQPTLPSRIFASDGQAFEIPGSSR